MRPRDHFGIRISTYRVEIKFIRRIEPRENFGALPAIAAEFRVQHGFLRGQIMRRCVAFIVIGEHQQKSGAAAAHGIAADLPSGSRITHIGRFGAVWIVRRYERCRAIAQIVLEFRLRAKCEFTHMRAKTFRAHNEIETPRAAIDQFGVDTAGIVV